MINRQDTIVIASVSCIYSLGNPADYKNLAFSLSLNQEITRGELIKRLIFIQYARNDMEKSSGTFQVQGDVIEVNLPYQKEKLRIELYGNFIQRLSWVTKHENRVVSELDNTFIFPAKYFVTTQEKRDAALASIQAELEEYAPTLKNPLYQERIKARVTHDMELLKERGFCPGIENYSVTF